VSRFDPATSILAGMDTAALQAQLAALQKAYLDLAAGVKAVTLSYAMGDGAKAVTYTETDIGKLTQAIRLVQAQLGIVHSPRHALGVRF
jgi:hypothetical protein